MASRKCSTTVHGVASGAHPHLANELTSVTSTRNVPSSLKTFMEKNGFFKKERKDRNVVICKACILVARERSGSGSSATQTSEATATNEMDTIEPFKDAVVQIIDLIKKDDLEIHEIKGLMGALAEKDKKYHQNLPFNGMDIDKKMKLILSENYSDTWKKFQGSYFGQYVQQLVNFEGLSVEAKRKAIILCVSSFESMSKALNPKFISPLSLGQNVILHSFTGSRSAVQMFSCVQPAGGYTTLQNLISEMAAQTPKFPEGDILIGFDNQQIVGRNYRISLGSQQPVSVVTTLVVFQESQNAKSQRNEISTNLNLSAKGLLQKYQAHGNLARKIHGSYRASWVQTRISTIEIELGENEVDLEETTKDPNYEMGLEYSRVPKSKSSCKMSVMESPLVNPNSFETVGKILSTIQDMSDATDPSRRWVTVYCDGLPFNLATKLLDNSFSCQTCKTSGMNLDCKGKKGHDVSFTFNKIVLRPGGGHIEMNLVRGFFSHFFEILIKPLAQQMGFTTPRALDYCKAALDNHKSWQLLKIIFISLSDEIIRLFVKCAKEKNVDRNEVTFAEWINGERSPNLVLGFNIAFNVLHPLFLYRAAIRQCSFETAEAALFIASDLFYGYNHPIYRMIITRDCLFLLNLPKAGAEAAKCNSVCRENGKVGQAPDFHVEEKNQLQKQSWLSRHGTPTKVQWTKSSASLNEFEKLKAKVTNDLGLESESSQKTIHLGNEYCAARKLFRQVFENSTDKLTTFSADDPVPLNPTFINFLSVCRENKEKYVQSFLLKKKCSLNLLDAEDLEILDFSQIQNKCRNKIKQLGVHRQLRAHYSRELEQSTTCDEIISIIGEIEETIDELEYQNENRE